MTMNEADGQCPSNWRQRKLGDIAVLVMGQSPPSSFVNEVGLGLPFIQGNAEFGYRHPKPTKWCTQPTKVARKGEVLLSVRAPVGALNVADQDLAIGRGLSAIRFRDGAPDFGWYALNLAVSQFGRTAQGSTFMAIGRKDVASLELFLPPLPEQRKIAEILSTVDDAIEKTDAVIQQVRVVKGALMQQLFTRGIPGRHTRFKQTEVGEIPEEWEVVKLGEVAKVQTGVAKNSRRRWSKPVELPYLRVANVQDGFVDLREIKTIIVEASEEARCELKKGDVLFTEGGDPDKLGRGTIWTAPITPCLHQNHVFAVRPDTTRLLPEFLATYAASYQGKRYFLIAAKQTTNLASVNATQLRAFPIAIPTIEEQRDTLAALETPDQYLMEERQALDCLRELKAALMQALLTGEVRVKVEEETCRTG